MKIATRQLAQHLKKGLAPLYCVHGAEALLALEAADAIRAAARASGCDEREVFTAEPGADWSKLAANAANLSLFSSRRGSGRCRACCGSIRGWTCSTSWAAGG